MRHTRKKVIKTVYKDEDDSDQGGDFSDSGSEAEISEESASSEEAASSAEEFADEPPKITKQAPKKQPKQCRKLPAARKSNFTTAFISKIKHYAAEGDEEGETKEKLFTVKDLSEKDKLLPSVLNLSESDSSEDESPGASSSRQSLTVPSTSKLSQVLDSNDEIADYNMWASIKQDDSEEVAKQTFLELEKHKNEIEETKACIEKYKAARDNSKTDIDVKDLLAQGEEVLPQAKSAIITKSRKKKADSDSEIEDWEEVHDIKPIPRQGIQLVVDFPDGAARNSKIIDVEMMMRRKINRVKKEYQVYMHKVHVLCWIGHGNYICRVLNDQEVMAAALSLMPSKDAYPGERIDMKYVEQITTWYKDKLTLKQDKNEDKFKPKAPPLKDILLSQAKSRAVTSKKYLVFLFVSLLRALGLKCRVMFNFVTLPLKPPNSELCSLSTKQKESNAKTADVKKEGKSPSNTNTCKRKSTKPIPQVDGNYDRFSTDSSDFSDELDNIVQVDGNDDAPVKSRSTRASRSKQNVKNTENETEDVTPPKRAKRASPKPEPKSPKANELPVKRKRATRKSPAPEKTESTSKDKNDKTTTNKTDKTTTKPSQGTGSKTAVNPSPRKTRNITSEGKTKTDAKPKQPAKKESKTINKPVIKITDENGTTNVSSKYFEAQEKSSITKKLSLTRNRSQSTTPTNSSIGDKNNTDNAKTKSRTRSAPGQSVETSKYFASEEISGKKAPKRQRKQKVDVLEDAQRVSHKDLVRNTKPDKNDVTGDLVSLIKGRVREANAGPKKRTVKGKSSKDSDDDSDFLPEEQIKRDPDSEDDFKPTKISPKVPVKRKIDRRVLSSDDDLPKNRVDVWCEVFVEELEQWVSVDVIKAKVHCASEIYSRATHPVAYIVGWDNNNYLKDLTRRYVPSWNTVTRKLRAESRWWTEAVRPWRGPGTARDREEDEGLDRMQLEAPLPKSIAEYKNHPLYALKRHLLKFEALYPADAATLGFVRGEPVYARECVYTCRSRDTWLKEAKTVKLGEKPYKVVKARPKWDKLSNRCITDLPLEVFGPWQVQDYEPPTAEDGIVPRNAYGNVELFKECMLPKGTVHLKLPGLSKVAKKLHVDCAPAMTGFDFNGGFTHPVFDGFVVCSEFADIITEAWHEDQEEQERRETEKLEARVYGNWRRLIQGLFIRERLKTRYGFTEPRPAADAKRRAKPPKLVVKKRRSGNNKDD